MREEELMKVTFSLKLEAWLNYIEIEAKSLCEAKEILNNMSLSDLLSMSNVRDYEVNNVTYKIDDLEEN